MPFSSNKLPSTHFSHSAGGLILDFAVQTLRGVAVFQPVMNGNVLFLIRTMK